jgi:hypothetical protein
MPTKLYRFATEDEKSALSMGVKNFYRRRAPNQILTKFRVENPKQIWKVDLVNIPRFEAHCLTGRFSLFM